MVWGQSLMSPGQNTFTPARDGVAVWIRNAGLMGECPASGWTCGLPPFPGLRQSSKTGPGPPLAQVAHLHMCGFSWGRFSFLGQGVLQRPLPGRQTRRGFFPLAWGTQVSLTLQPPCKAQPRAGSFPSPWGLPPFNSFLPNNNRQESRGTSQKPRGEVQRPPALQPPLWYTVFAPFPRSTCQRLELGDLCQGLPLSPGEAHISGEHLCPVQLPAQQRFGQGSCGKLKHLVLASKTSILRLGQLGRHGCLLTARPRLPVDRPLLD